jgi:hypothetical protein
MSSKYFYHMSRGEVVGFLIGLIITVLLLAVASQN